MAVVSDDCIYQLHVPTDVLDYGGRHSGKAAIGDCLARILDEFDFVASVVDWIHGSGQIVRTRVIYYYQHDTGEQLDGVLRHVWRVVEGRIVQVDEYHDVPRLKAFLDMVRGLRKS